MSNDPDSGDGDPDPVRAWLADLAEERELSEGELFERLLAGDGETMLDTDVNDLAQRVDALDAAIETLDDDVDELIRDVRERVIQVKREADAKAPHDHNHPGLARDVGRLEAHVDALATDFVGLDASTDDLTERLDATEDRLEGGFSNFESVLEYLVDTTDDLQEKLEAVAEATLDLRRRTGRLAEADARRSAADHLRQTASEHGIVDAKCENCGATIDLRLLAAPDCPHCDARFVELEPRRGFFRSSVLHTGDRPALEGEVAGEPTDLASIVAEEGSTPPTVDRAATGGGGSTASESDESETASSSIESDTADDEIVERADGAEPAASTPGGAADEHVETVSGIGPAYAERLRAAGVETVGELALSDPSILSEETGIEPGRLEKLVRRARASTDAE